MIFPAAHHGKKHITQIVKKPGLLKIWVNDSRLNISSWLKYFERRCF
jgi:hypothetical protein